MKPKVKSILPIIFITMLCAAGNLYWFFHQGANPNFFIQLNLLTAFTIMLIILLPAIKQLLKK